jgi:hypothetical protein
MSQTQYPIAQNKDDILPFLQEIARLREIEDVPDFTNLPRRFVSGRTTTRIPSTPSDVLATDNIGDIVTDAPNGFEYKLVDNAGTAVWDRRTLNIAW